MGVNVGGEFIGGEFLTVHLSRPPGVEVDCGVTKKVPLRGADSKKKIAWVSWVNVCKPKKEGGLGVRDLRLVNNACLVSGGGGSFLKEHESVAIFFWLGTQVDSQSDWFSEGVFKRIGNGKLTYFWFDPRVDMVLLRIRYQSLFQASDQCLDRDGDMGNWVSGVRSPTLARDMT
ncbi:hypothetical protein L195_g040039 [Trifolium pratense]|uniref:Cysteine-rich receptor-like protein kinase n=1 Tax=Trifolium pratense TaxID=57577 RepID=A0A2K3LZL8_TRIPR|nr:hypothetical protein L195_g040039 [Trifolium pratense]